ncbi:MAG: YkgJ family cysteine cluster protein [Methanomicrobiales archaeon]|nr:YkgJ family cysteine cluster protein [Methanomicrobiales archaeon]
MHRIVEDYGNLSFLLYNCYNGEKAAVTVDPDKRDLYHDQGIFISWPDACPFLRNDTENKRICCTIHQTRPDLCREFGCWRLLILTPQGKRAGRIMGTRYLSSEDSMLSHIWKQHVDTLNVSSDTEWDQHVIRILQLFGYRVFH